MPAQSLATGQRSLKDPSKTYPLTPPLTTGTPGTEDPTPVEVTYDYDAVDTTLFEAPLRPGLDRWAPLLPPLAGPGLAAGDTPLVESRRLGDWVGIDEPVYVKDESRNPTWSQKDRLARCTVADAVARDAPGLVVSSSGNHGAATAAHAARADRPCVVLTAPETPGAVLAFIERYATAVIAVPDWEVRRAAVDAIATDWGYVAASTRTAPHTGHPYGPEGYKPIAYELYAQLGTVPGTVAIPTSFAEILFGVWKGFTELEALDVTDATPTMVPCEPRARGPLATAIESGQDIVTVAPEETAAYSIRATQNSYRGVHTVRESDGFAATFTEPQLDTAQDRLASHGLWQEASGAGGLAGLYAAVTDHDRTLDPPVVCLGTSAGFKDGDTATVPTVAADVATIKSTLSDDDGLPT
ncbi:MAG: pyridoxal-phosphate dependent enzyme [Halobacteriaceae archaeon]